MKSISFSRCLWVERGEEAHHSESCCLGADGRKGRIGFRAVHGGTKTMRVGLNLGWVYRSLYATKLLKVPDKKQGFVDVNRCWRATAGTSNSTAQPQCVAVHAQTTIPRATLNAYLPFTIKKKTGNDFHNPRNIRNIHQNPNNDRGIIKQTTQPDQCKRHDYARPSDTTNSSSHYKHPPTRRGPSLPPLFRDLRRTFHHQHPSPLFPAPHILFQPLEPQILRSLRDCPECVP